MPNPTDEDVRYSEQISEELIRLKIVPPALSPLLLEKIADFVCMDDEVVATRLWAHQQEILPQELKTRVFEHWMDTGLHELGKLTPEERAALSMRLAAKFLPKKNGA